MSQSFNIDEPALRYVWELLMEYEGRFGREQLTATFREVKFRQFEQWVRMREKDAAKKLACGISPLCDEEREPAPE